MTDDREVRIERARLSLTGLSVGDAFGEKFFGKYALVRSLIDSRALPEAPWPWTDDTQMALSIVEILEQHGTIDQDALAQAFARRYEPRRKYGLMAHHLLQSLRKGASWKAVAAAAFDGQGSLGNGGAMRVGPVGAFFADNVERAVDEARRSAEVTHTHPEGKAGAIAVAAAAALVWQDRETRSRPTAEIVGQVASLTPAGKVREGLEEAATMPPDAPVFAVAGALGNGGEVTAADTVPFTVWAAAQFRESFVEALWSTVSALGDRDTTCAIVGGIVALSTGARGIPGTWLAAREPLP